MPAITGVGMTPFAKCADEPVTGLLTTAAERALADADAAPGDVDSLLVGNMAAEAFANRSGLVNALAGQLGIRPVSGRRIEHTSATGAHALRGAVEALAADGIDTALVVCGEVMSAVDTETSTEIISRITHDLEYRNGITLPSFAGLATEAYLRRTGATREDLARVAVWNHRNGATNPVAQFQREITVEEVLDSPPVAEPLCLYDCCPVSDGAAALVLSRSEDGVSVTACESAFGTHAVADRDSLLAVPSVRRAGEAALAATDLVPAEVDVACLHDAFTILEWLELEALGFVDDGTAWMQYREGSDRTELPAINPGGGLKARGHPLGATGLSQVVELVWRLRSDHPSGESVPGTHGLAVSLAGFGNSSVVTLLEAADD